MKKTQMKLILVRVSVNFKLPRVQVIESQLYLICFVQGQFTLTLGGKMKPP